jgi:cytochrome c-type biogenesis protein CcmE
MTPRQRRMTLVAGIVAGVAIAGALGLSAFRSNVTFFFDPTQVAAGQVKNGEHFRLGGMVTQGSVKRTPGSLEVHFVVTDFKHDVPVTYTGVLPDLFREGTGVVAHGHMQSNGTFVADEVLAKHDEKYMPPEVARSLKRRHGESREDSVSGEQTAPGGEPGQAANGAQSPSTTSTGQPSANGPLSPSTTGAWRQSDGGASSPSATNAQQPPADGALSPSTTDTQQPSTGGVTVDSTITSGARARLATSSLPAGT